jgi:hypothetical protein
VAFAGRGTMKAMGSHWVLSQLFLTLFVYMAMPHATSTHTPARFGDAGSPPPLGPRRRGEDTLHMLRSLARSLTNIAPCIGHNSGHHVTCPLFLVDEFEMESLLFEMITQGSEGSARQASQRRRNSLRTCPNEDNISAARPSATTLAASRHLLKLLQPPVRLNPEHRQATHLCLHLFLYCIF